MAKLETVIKEAIARGARRQVRVVVTPLRREVVRLRKKVTDLQATVTTLRRRAVGWKRLMEASPMIPQVSEEDAKAGRLSPRLIESLRRRLGLSQSVTPPIHRRVESRRGHPGLCGLSESHGS